jgi:hypothetical protein
VALGDYGRIVASDDPAGGSAWSRTTITSYNALSHVSCASRSLCVATDGMGHVVASPHPTRAAATWRVAKVHQRGLIDIWCQSASLCVAVDYNDNLLTSTAPTAGAGAWSSDPVAGVPSFGGITCASTSLCVAGGRFHFIATSTDPASGGSTWSAFQVGPESYGERDPAEISCPSPSLCVALGFRGGPGHADRVFSSSDPTGGAQAWRIVDVHANHLADVSCPSVRLCVVVRDNPRNQVLFSTRPTGGAGAWKATEVKRPSQPGGACGGRSSRCPTLRSVSCASNHLCAAIGRFRGRNVVFASTDPTGASRAWKRARVHADARFGLRDVSCPSPKLCVIVDDHGRAFVGRERR